MRRTLKAVGMIICLALPGGIAAQDVQPSCEMCSATYIPAEEFQEFLGIESVDQQVRSLDIGKSNAQVAIAHRGKQDAKIDLWLKEAAPSTELRRWFSHDPTKWEEFKHRYFEELRARDQSLQPIRERLRSGSVTFVFASRETKLNSAVALKEYLANT